jgi:hypothetical protein
MLTDKETVCKMIEQMLVGYKVVHMGSEIVSPQRIGLGDSVDGVSIHGGGEFLVISVEEGTSD